MNKQDRSEWFARLKSEEQQASRRAEEILQQQRLRVKRRAGRRKVWMACAVSLLMLAAAGGGIFWMISLISAGQDRPGEEERLPFGETIYQGEGTQEAVPPEETQEAIATVWGENGAAVNRVFFGNTVMPTAGGSSVDVSQLLTPSWIQEQYLTVNPFSRPCIAMNSIQHIAIHYVGNAGTTARQNRSYFEGLKDTQITQASSHFIVGLEGEIIQCIPLNEMSYCTNERNVDTISIEVCHPDEGGQFNETTYQSVVRLTAWLCQKFSLPVDNVIRHHDVTGKVCPKYYVEHPQAWEALKADIQTYLNQNPDIN